MESFGRSSFFVYWIHVEMVYGVLSLPLHRRLPFERSVVALGLFSVFLFGLAEGKTWIVARWRRRRAVGAT